MSDTNTVVPMTATKANWAGLSGSFITVVTYLVARFTGLVELPAESLLADALIAIANGIVGFVVPWVVTWLAPANKPAA